MAAEGLIVTAGAVDTHVHYICPQLADEAIASGITTLYPPEAHSRQATRACVTRARVCLCGALSCSCAHAHACARQCMHNDACSHARTRARTRSACARRYGGGTGPASGSCATTCTPAPDQIAMMLQAYGCTGLSGNRPKRECA